MKVFAALLFVGSLSVVAQAELPQGSEYFGAFFCPTPEDSDVAECLAPCGGSDDCAGDGMLCCPFSQDCRRCSQGIPSDGGAPLCRTGDEEVAPLTITLDEEECEYCVCVNGMFYCNELEELDDGTCPDLPQPIEGAVCSYEEREVPPTEFTVIRSEEDCEICICGNGVLFCRSCEPDITCEYGGHELRLGETVFSNGDCSLCTCRESGEVECATQDDCTPMCMYRGEEVAVGDTVPSEDGCNECTCLEDSTLSCTERACECDNGEERVRCSQSPCANARCFAHQNATCYNDYCGGCNTRWMLDGEDVTEICMGEETSEPELTHIPTCPADASDTCDELCSGHDSCPDTQLCCRGCGSSCQVPINLPSYSVPLMCPRQTVVLDEDSRTCDLQCQYNDQCPGEKICCYSGCSSSCQYGVPPPNSCNVVRRLLENDRDEPTSDEDESPLGEFLPGCHREGFFNPVQSSEANRWCVNVVTGEPIGSAYTAGDGLTLTCPNCTHNGRVFYVGQSFNDECNDCVCTETGVAACTRRACLDPCVLPASPGTCEDRQNRYFFDRDSRLCQKFVYSGCGGNANRFSSVYNCLHACDSESVCLLDWDEGEPCNDEEDSANPTRDLFYYYNAEEGACNSMVGYRCGGNGNRFHSGIDCLRTCDPSNPGPTDVHGNRCWEIACDIPFCGEGVQPVSSDDFCCPVCPYEQECEDDEFQCLDGSCIPARLECDGLSDCDDGSDERDDGCAPFIIACEFPCSDEQCVPDDYVCNGVLECDNGRDEVDCDVEVPQAPSYTLFECPESSDLLGDCDESQCMVDTECGEGKMCCLNNCNQRSCTEPHTSDIAGCSAIAQHLSTSNASYIPQCDSVGQFKPLQCTGEGESRLCWCVNIITGKPFTELSSDGDIDCRRCDYAGSRNYPGDVYTKTDDCNTCVCDSSGDSICGRRACTEESCEVHRVTIDHGETEEFDCVICTCLYGLNCTKKNCSGIEVVRETVQVEMTFSGELPSSEEEQEEVERGVVRSILGMYGVSMDLDESQVEIDELRQGSIIVVVEFKDTEDDTGANVTILVVQLEKDYEDGVLVIRNGNKAYVPAGQFSAETVSQEDEDEDEHELFWWHWLLVGLAGAVLVLFIFFVAFMMFACLRKRAGNNGKVQVEPNPYTGTVEMKKVPLDEKA